MRSRFKRERACLILDECPLQVANNSHDRIHLLFPFAFCILNKLRVSFPSLSFKDNFMGFVQRNARVIRSCIALITLHPLPPPGHTYFRCSFPRNTRNLCETRQYSLSTIQSRIFRQRGVLRRAQFTALKERCEPFRSNNSLLEIRTATQMTTNPNRR